MTAVSPTGATATRKALAVACVLLAVAVALVTMVFASGAVDPEADSAAWALGVGAILGLFVTTALLAVVPRSSRLASWKQRSPAGYWLVVAASLAVCMAQVVHSAIEGLQLEVLFLPATLGLLVFLLALMVDRVRPGFIAAGALGLGLAAVSFRDGPYEDTLGFWLPRIAVLALLLAGLAFMAREVSARGAH